MEPYARPFEPTRTRARARDNADPLGAFRHRFDVPGCYLDGNSLGPVNDAAERCLARVLEEWRNLGVEGWTNADPPWFEYAERVGDDLAPLVGAKPGEVVVANSTTVNIHSLVATFFHRAHPGAPPYDPGSAGTVLVNDLDFPTDHYAIRAQLRQCGLNPDEHLTVVESRDGRMIEEDDVERALSEEDVAVLFLPSVLYRSGQLLDVERLTRAAHEQGAYAGFDLAHSIGVVPHNLHDTDVDFAAWCHYKYINAGPGAVAGLYVREAHHGLRPALAGWWGHEKATQFEMRDTYTPADSAGAFQIGTPPLLSLAPVEGSVELVREAGIDRIRAKSIALCEFWTAIVDDADGYKVGSPRDPERRGGHVAVEHPYAEGVSRALKARDVVVDFRPPDVVRFCPAPLYVGFEDLIVAGEQLRAIHENREFEGRHGGEVT